MSQDFIDISVTVDIPPNSTQNPTAGQVAFKVTSDPVQLTPGDPSHDLTWRLSGTYNDGSTPFPTELLQLANPGGITWYSAEMEERLNPGLNPGQLQQLGLWLGNASNTPAVVSGGQSASVTIERSGMTGILQTGETLVLRFNISIVVAAEASQPWVPVDHDPEVDIEMDA